jgi:hypothetical protein
VLPGWRVAGTWSDSLDRGTVAESPPVVDIVLQVGSPYEIVTPGRREAVEDLANELRRFGHSIDVDIIEPVPGTISDSAFESIGIFIGGTVSGAVLSQIAGDLYKVARDRARMRFREKQSNGEPGPRNTAFKIYGPDGNILREWNSRMDDSD